MSSERNPPMFYDNQEVTVIRKGRKNTRIKTTSGKIMLVETAALKVQKVVATQVLNGTENPSQREQKLLQKIRQMMNEHGLRLWNLAVDTHKKRFGCCYYRDQKISISRRHIMLSPEAEVIDTALHEIAHALVGPNHGHDRVWKAMCVKVGARPQRCGEVDDQYNSDAPWTLECVPCAKKWFRYRRPQDCGYSCPRCRSSLKWQMRRVTGVVI